MGDQSWQVYRRFVEALPGHQQVSHALLAETPAGAALPCVLAVVRGWPVSALVPLPSLFPAGQPRSGHLFH